MVRFSFIQIKMLNGIECAGGVCSRVVVLIVTFGYISTEGSLAFGQAYRGALPPLPPGGEKTTSGNKYLM